MADSAAAERVVRLLVTSGGPAHDGGERPADNNVWIIGGESQAVVVDAAHDHRAIARALGDRELMAVVCTHAHDGHVNAAVELAELCAAPILLHPGDTALWHRVHPDREPDAPLLQGERLQVDGVELEVLHTPGHTPGGVSLYAPGIGAVFTGDTLVRGGPGAAGRPSSDAGTIIDSIRDRLLALPPETVVHPGHGPTTTIGAEAAHLQEWIRRDR